MNNLKSEAIVGFWIISIFSPVQHSKQSGDTTVRWAKKRLLLWICRQTWSAGHLKPVPINILREHLPEFSSGLEMSCRPLKNAIWQLTSGFTPPSSTNKKSQVPLNHNSICICAIIQKLIWKNRLNYFKISDTLWRKTEWMVSLIAPRHCLAE